MSEEGNIYIGIPDVANLSLPDPDLRNLYIDLENRTFWVTGEIDGTTRDIAKYIMQWNREDKGKVIQNRTPIKLIIASPGGSLDVAEGLISIIKLSKTPVWGLATECVASAASLIYLACHRKYILPNAYLIFHEGSCSNMGGNFAEIKAAMDDYEQQVEKMTVYYIENTGYTDEEVRKNIKSDWYIRSKEALEKGVADAMLDDLDIIL